jgi:hypothetical protein
MPDATSRQSIGKHRQQKVSCFMSEKKIRVGLIGAGGRCLPIDCRLVASGISSATEVMVLQRVTPQHA